MSESDLRVERLVPGDESLIKDAIAAYSFAEYRAYRMLGKGIAADIVYQRLLRTLQEHPPAGVYAARRNGRLVGLVGLGMFPWGEACFGLRMAQWGDLIVIPSSAGDTVSAALISAAGEICRQHGIAHVSCKVDSEAVQSVHALEARGFRLMSTMVTYVFNRRRHRLRMVKPYAQVRRFEARDLAEIIAMARGQFIHSRFSRDRIFSRDQIDSFYRTWIEDICADPHENVMYVAQRGERLTGFFLFKKDKLLSALSGLAVYGNGLSGVTVQGRGTYPSILVTAMQDERVELAEYETQIDNRQVLAVWQRLGLDLMRCRHVFHLWL